MTEQLRTKIFAAIERWRNEAPQYYDVTDPENPFPEMEQNYYLARQRMANESLVQLAIIGNQMKLRKEPTLTLARKEIKVARFLANAFGERYNIMWHFRGITLDLIWSRRNNDLTPLEAETQQKLKESEEKAKRKAEEKDYPTAKRTREDVEITTDTLEDWLSGAAEWLDGVGTPLPKKEEDEAGPSLFDLADIISGPTP